VLGGKEMIDKYSSKELIKQKYPGYTDKLLKKMIVQPLSIEEGDAIIRFGTVVQFWIYYNQLVNNKKTEMKNI